MILRIHHIFETNRIYFMFKRLSLAMIIAILSLLDSLAHPAPQLMDVVDWSRGVVVTHVSSKVQFDGRGTPVDQDSGAAVSLNRGRTDAYRKARDRAVENLVRLIKGIRVDADTMLSDILEQSDTAQQRIASVIAARMKVREYPNDFASSACTAELKIGDLLHAVPYSFPGDDFPVRVDNPIPTSYTSLIIDARGLPVEPMILPSIYDENGLEVYGRYYVDIRYAGKHGLASYAHNEDEAMKIRAAGGHPYYSVAVKEMKGCPVLADRDIRRIFSSSDTVAQLKRCKVIFIIDKKKK
jgi:hypothetical protein